MQQERDCAFVLCWYCPVYCFLLSISLLKEKEPMNCSNDKQERLNQREILKQFFPDYTPLHHDVFVVRLNKEIDKNRIAEYMKERNIAN